MKMENAPKVYTKGDVEVLRQTVAQGATDSELRMFIEIAKATGLNPFKREIWFIKANGRVQMMTGINGFYTIANSSQHYDGIETGLVGPQGEYLPLTYPGQDYIGAWAKVYRKDRRMASEGVAMLAEYDKGHGNWKAMKRVMITKCAESIALRKGFPQELNGLYTAEEMPVEYTVKPEEKRAELKAKAEADKLPPTYESSSEPVVYQIPYADAAGRQKLAKLGFKPDKTQKPWTWTGSVLIPELEECRIVTTPAMSVPVDAIITEQELNEIEVEWEE